MSSPRWAQQGALAILLTIFGYIAYNVAVIQIGGAIINVALMNILAGLIGIIIFRDEIKAKPIWWISLLGASSFLCIIFGLQLTHASLKDPSSAIEVVYDFLVISSVALWALVEKPLGLPKTDVQRFDLLLHFCMAALVILRLAVHWQAGWSLQSFLPVLLAVTGYWLFNVSIRLAQKQPKSTRATTLAMNFFGGLFFLLIAIFSHNTLGINVGMITGTLAIVMIVAFLSRAYHFLAPHGLAPLVVAGTYDGLLILAPIAMWLIYKQKFLPLDLVITLGFVLVMSTRVFLYGREKVNGGR